MFDLKKQIRFWGRTLLAVESIVVVLFALGVITELHAYQISLIDVWPFCLLSDPSCPPADWDFWLFALLNMIPGLAAVIAVFWLTANFVRSLYGLESVGEGGRFLRRCLIGTRSFKPFLLIRGGAIQNDETDALRRIGGPGGLVIYNDSAVVLERAGRLTRVLGPGFHRLERFEKVWDVIDLRLQRWEFAVNAMTKEGIPVTCNADVSFKIDDGGQEPTRETPYPMTEEAVFKASTSKWIREAWRSDPDRLMTWTKRIIIGGTEGTLRTILARYPLDQLIELQHRQEIRQELEDALHKSASGWGVKVTRVALGDIKVKDEVTQQWIEKWQAEAHRRMMELEARGRAARTVIEANARIQAQVKMIVETTRLLDEMAKYGKGIPSRFVIMRFTEMIKRTSVELSGRFYLPYEVMRTLEKLEDRIEGHGGENQESGADDGRRERKG